MKYSKSSTNPFNKSRCILLGISIVSSSIPSFYFAEGGGRDAEEQRGMSEEEDEEGFGFQFGVCNHNWER